MARYEGWTELGTCGCLRAAILAAVGAPVADAHGPFRASVALARASAHGQVAARVGVGGTAVRRRAFMSNPDTGASADR